MILLRPNHSIYQENIKIIEEQKHKFEEHEKSINAIRQNYEAQIDCLQEEQNIKLQEGR